ncbi:MAG: transposase [Bacteroidetes bacterium]|nr:transposase [Bacteroidota bacterium]
MKEFSRKPPRWQQDNSLYFLTLCTYKHRKYLHRDKVPEFMIDELLYYSKKIKELISYTIMPDHIHILLEAETVKSMSEFLRDFKKYTTKGIEMLIEIKDEFIWQRGTMDHCIRQSMQNQDFEDHLLYIYYNSWKHLGIKPKEYPYHNFKEIVEKGWIENDFLDFDAPREFDIYE